MTLLWEESVGKRQRDSEREERRRFEAQRTKYLASVERLKRLQE